MRKAKLWLASVLAAAALLFAGQAQANISETRYQYDQNFPEGSFDLATFRATLRGLHQLDMAALRPLAYRILDSMEYGSDASAQAVYSGTGVTITTDSSVEQEGSYNLKAVIDGTDNREFEKNINLDLSAFTSITLWERSSGTSDAIRFFVEDTGGDQSYWDITTNASANTYQQDTLTLADPDGNNGTNATLSDISKIGFQSLDASTTYYFDTIKAVVGMTVVIEGTDLGDYYRHVYLDEQPLVINPKAAPAIIAPSTNPRIDILEINSAGTLSWVTGTEASTPTAPWSSVSSDKIQIAEVYMRTTMDRVLAYEDKDTDNTEGYILRDVRPFLRFGQMPMKGADVASASSMTLGNDGNVFDITGTTNITSITAKPAGMVVWMQFDGALTVVDGNNLKLGGNFTTAAESVLQLVSDGTNWYEVSRAPPTSTFLALSDTPSSYSGQALKTLRVNSAQTALEFVALKVSDLNDTPSSLTGKAGHVLVVNSAENGFEFTQLSGTQTFTSEDSPVVWTAPAGVTNIFFSACAGGGGGGGSGNNTNQEVEAGGGGGGGGCVENIALNVTPGQDYDFTIGASGAGSPGCIASQPAPCGTVNNGSNGGNTTFEHDGGTNTLYGGSGGQGGDGDGSTTCGAGGSGGGGNHASTINGSAGSNRSGSTGGAGGASANAAGGSPDNNGNDFGSGGGGDNSSGACSANAQGGNGGGGYVEIRW